MVILIKIEEVSFKVLSKGDQKSFSIAAASIIAKIHRDRYMQFLSYKFPDL